MGVAAAAGPEAAAGRVRVLVVDGQEMVRRGLGIRLEIEPDLEHNERSPRRPQSIYHRERHRHLLGGDGRGDHRQDEREADEEGSQVSGSGVGRLRSGDKDGHARPGKAARQGDHLQGDGLDQAKDTAGNALAAAKS